jgi:hypothetical protein
MAIKYNESPYEQLFLCASNATFIDNIATQYSTEGYYF